MAQEKLFSSHQEWLSMKATLADAFAALHFAESMTLKEGDVENISLCLKTLNDYLEKDLPDE